MNIIIGDFKESYLEDIVSMHRKAFSDHFNSKIGNIYTKAFLQWFINKNGKIFICAVDKDTDKVLGYVCGAPVGYASQLNKDLLKPIIISFILKPWLMFNSTFFRMLVPKLKLIFGQTQSSEITQSANNQPVMSLTSIAVSNKAQGLGIATKLLKEFENQAKALGINNMQLTVKADNIIAINAYQKNGWVKSEVNGSYLKMIK